MIIQKVNVTWEGWSSGYPAVIASGRPNTSLPSHYYEAWSVDADGNVTPEAQFGKPQFEFWHNQYFGKPVWIDPNNQRDPKGTQPLPTEKFHDIYGWPIFRKNNIGGSVKYEGKARYFDGMTSEDLKQTFGFSIPQKPNQAMPAGGLLSLPILGQSGYLPTKPELANGAATGLLWDMPLYFGLNEVIGPGTSNTVDHNIKSSWTPGGKTTLSDKKP